MNSVFNHQFPAIALALLLSLCMYFPGNAQQEAPQEDSVRYLQQVEVYAAQQLQPKSPFAYTEVSDSVLNSLNFGQEASRFICTAPGVTVYSDAGSLHGYSYFRLRGIDQTRINVTLDGIPLNEPEDQGAYFSNVPDLFNSVAAMQVRRGVSLSQYGVSSYGGSIALRTESLFKEAYRRAGASLASFGTYRLYGELNTGMNEGKGLYLRASTIQSKGYKYRAENAGQSVFYKAGLQKEDHQLQFMGFVGRQQNQMAWLGVPMEEIKEDPRTNANAAEDDRFLQTLNSLRHTYSINRQWVLSSSVYHNFLDGFYDFDLNNFLGEEGPGDVFSYNFRAHWLGAFSTLNYAKENLELTTGLHGSYYQRRHIGSEESLGELYNNTGFRKELSGFSKLVYTAGAFRFVGDVQLRHSRFSYQGDVNMPDLQWTFLNPKVGITYTASPVFYLYYSLGYTGREPTRNDLFMGNDNLPADESGQPLLGSAEAEYVLDQEAGIRLEKEKVGLAVNAFLMRFQNEIILSGQFGPNGLALTEGVDKSYRTGIELEGDWKIKSWLQLQGNLSYNYNRIIKGDTRFSPILSPAWLGNMRAVVSPKDWTFYVGSRYQGASYIDFANTVQLDDYLLFDAGAGYRFKQVQLQFQLNNLSNQQYFTHGYIDFAGIPRYFVQAPRNYAFSVEWTF